MPGSRGRGLRRPPVELPFISFLRGQFQSESQSAIEEGCDQSELVNAFAEATPSPGAAIRLANSTLIKWAANSEKLKGVDPLEIPDATIRYGVERFSRLFFFENVNPPSEVWSASDRNGDGLIRRKDSVPKIKTEPAQNQEDDSKDGKIESHTLKPEV